MKRNKADVEILTELPMKIFNKRECIDWDKFIPGNIVMRVNQDTYEFYVEKIFKSKHSRLDILFKGELFNVPVNGFINGEVGNIVGTKTTKYTYSEGDTIKLITGEILILKQIRTKNGYDKYTRRGYTIKCLSCNGVFDVVEENFKKESYGCGVCQNRIVIRGINDIATTHPDKVKYFLNIEDTYNHTYGSEKRVDAICPICKQIKRGVTIKEITRSDFNCHRCGNKVSLGERIMFSFLTHVMEYDFIKEYNPKWYNLGMRRYDFCFEKNSERYIVEMHGIQHYEECRKSVGCRLLDVQNNDKEKHSIAINNGINPNNYIIIDCRVSDFDYIRENIINSKLYSLFNIESLNWDKIKSDSIKNRVISTCEMWNNGYSIKKIKETYKCSSTPILEDLKIGNDIGICNYTVEESIKRGARENCNTKYIKQKEIKKVS